MPLKIEDYAMIGDCETAALVGRNGSIDWLCLPRFDSPACFAALLGNPEHGRWLVAPAEGPKRVERRYRDGTLILETTFETETGTVRLIDFMPTSTQTKCLIRIVEGLTGQVNMRMFLTIRFDYGRTMPWIQPVESGIQAVGGPNSLILSTPAEMHGDNFDIVSHFTVSAGQRVPFVLTRYASHLPPPREVDPDEALNETTLWWKDWSSRCTYQGLWRDLVERSLITLKGLVYAPTGGMVAAPTTSLPEVLGGSRNWDYRFCWLRDATFTLHSFLAAGYVEEARAWREWLIRAIAGKPSQAHIMYGLNGTRRLTEETIDWLPGYEGSRPVRIGNAAHRQLQLDVFGYVLDALNFSRRFGYMPGENEKQLLSALMDFLESSWMRPDEGIWEVRGPRRQFTHSKVMAWVAFHRAVKAVEDSRLEGPVERWRTIRDEIHKEVCQGGFDADLGSFVQFYGSKEPDASLLMIPLVGFLPASDRRNLGTVKVIQERLTKDGFVFRYNMNGDVDGQSGHEGAFLVCTLWLADNLALQGRFDEAQQVFENVLNVRNDVGLLSEEYDTSAKRLLGNFPQALSHVGLINTALNITRGRNRLTQNAGR